MSGYVLCCVCDGWEDEIELPSRSLAVNDEAVLRFVRNFLWDHERDIGADYDPGCAGSFVDTLELLPGLFEYTAERLARARLYWADDAGTSLDFDVRAVYERDIVPNIGDDNGDYFRGLDLAYQCLENFYATKEWTVDYLANGELAMWFGDDEDDYVWLINPNDEDFDLEYWLDGFNDESWDRVIQNLDSSLEYCISEGGITMPDSSPVLAKCPIELDAEMSREELREKLAAYYNLHNKNS